MFPQHPFDDAAPVMKLSWHDVNFKKISLFQSKSKHTHWDNLYLKLSASAYANS